MFNLFIIESTISIPELSAYSEQINKIKRRFMILDSRI